MIENKIITITKENQFDKGWTLFHQFDLKIDRNRMFKETMISDIIRQITHSDEVYLILSESCLSSRIVDEIKWVNKYIKLNVIAKNADILKKYSMFNFNIKKVDDSIDFNYIGIKGKNDVHYMISDGYIEVDDTLFEVHFKNKNLKENYSFLNDVNEAIIIDDSGKKDYTSLIKTIKNNAIPCFYCVNSKNFNKKIFDFSKENSLNLLISDFTKNGIIVINKNNTISCVTMTSGGFFISYPIETINSFLGQVFKCDFCNNVIKTESIKGEVYSCFNGKIKNLDIENKKTIQIDVDIELMSDFVLEKFDSSIVEKHNDYSTEAKKVEYQFTLIPPLFNSDYVESKIYDDIHNLNSKWKSAQKLKINKIIEDYKSFNNQDYGFISFLKETELITNEFNERVLQCDYKNYYNWVNKIKEEYSHNLNNLIDICKKMFNSINEESSGTKFDKFDNEIAGYEQTIKEKNALIKKGIDVLSNKRRVEILTKKINDLLELKKHFENSSNTRNDKNLNSFISRCEELLNGKHKVSNNDSIGNIVKPKEETKLSKLEIFVDNYLYLIKKYDEDSLQIIDNLAKIIIPEDYVVYDKDCQRYIIINRLEEFETTKNLCDKFNLKCITRR